MTLKQIERYDKDFIQCVINEPNLMLKLIQRAFEKWMFLGTVKIRFMEQIDIKVINFQQGFKM